MWYEGLSKVCLKSESGSVLVSLQLGCGPSDM